MDLASEYALAQEHTNLQHELQEANLEITRHNADFEKIRAILSLEETKIDLAIQDVHGTARVSHFREVIKSIRNIVG